MVNLSQKHVFNKIEAESFFNNVQEGDNKFVDVLNAKNIPLNIQSKLFKGAKQLYNDLIEANISEENARLQGGAAANIAKLRADDKKLDKIESFGNEAFYSLKAHCTTEDCQEIMQNMIYGIVGKSIKYLKGEMGITHANVPNNRLEVSNNGLHRTFRDI